MKKGGSRRACNQAGFLLRVLDTPARQSLNIAIGNGDCLFIMNGGLSRLVVLLATAVLGLWFGSCRVRIVGRPYHERYILGRDKVVGATWHRGAIFLV